MAFGIQYVSLAGLVLFTTFLNLPFGFLRAKTIRYSLKWFLYIHLPIPFIYLLRQLLLLKAIVIPVLLAAAVTGQVFGGRLNREKSGDKESNG
jgi:hypothetical protein